MGVKKQQKPELCELFNSGSGNLSWVYYFSVIAQYPVENKQKNIKNYLFSLPSEPNYDIHNTWNPILFIKAIR